MKKENLRTVGVIGPNAYSIPALYGNYNGESDRWITNLDGIRMSAGEEIRVLYSKGCNLFFKPNEKLEHKNKYYSEAVTVAKRSDVVILCVGLDGTMEGEQGDTGNSDASGDKSDLLLPESQRILCDKVLALGKPVIMVINSGSSLDLSMYEKDASAIIQSWYSGEQGGRALAEILFGGIGPSGKLPLTFYYNDQKMPAFTDYTMQGRTYRFLKEKPWYPFGYGLSYTRYEYENLKVEYRAGRDLRVGVTVQNTGDTAGEEIVQCYLRYVGDAFEKPNHKLVGFQRVALESGEAQKLELIIPEKELYSVDEEGVRRLYSGEYSLFVGGCQPDQRSRELMQSEGRERYVAEGRFEV